MKLIDLLITFAVMFIVVSIALGFGEKTAKREIVVAAQSCWDADQRAVYIRVDGEYRIRCEP